MFNDLPTLDCVAQQVEAFECIKRSAYVDLSEHDANQLVVIFHAHDRTVIEKRLLEIKPAVLQLTQFPDQRRQVGDLVTWWHRYSNGDPAGTPIYRVHVLAVSGPTFASQISEDVPESLRTRLEINSEGELHCSTDYLSVEQGCIEIDRSLNEIELAWLAQYMAKRRLHREGKLSTAASSEQREARGDDPVRVSPIALLHGLAQAGFRFVPSGARMGMVEHLPGICAAIAAAAGWQGEAVEEVRQAVTEKGLHALQDTPERRSLANAADMLLAFAYNNVLSTDMSGRGDH